MSDNNSFFRFSRLDVGILLLDIFFISLGINAPNILVGYGLVIPAMMISILFTRPLRGSIIFFISHIIAAIILVLTASIFTSVVFLSLIARSILVGLIAYLYENKKINSPLLTISSLVILDMLMSYSIALLYYGYDAIEVGLDIYSALYIPFIYLAYNHYTNGKTVYSALLLLDMIIYYFSAAYFYAILLNIFSIIVLIAFLFPLKYTYYKKLTAIFIIVFIVLVPLSMPMIGYNFKIIMYPYTPSSWQSLQWRQTSQGTYCKQGNVFEYVYDPSRLRILDTCVTVEGTVATNIEYAEDGDICFDIVLDPQYNYMLSIGSIVLRKNKLHVEIVPGDQGNVIVPQKGDYIKVTGVWLVDTDHGSYSEIHPSWHIEILSHGNISSS